MDAQKFENLIKELTTYYNKTLTDFSFKVWYKHLSQELTEKELTNAIAQAIIHYQFMPTPKQIVELVKGNQEEHEKLEAEKEWEKIIWEISRKGKWSGLNISQKAYVAIRHIGGIRSIALAHDNELGWKQKEFVKEYQGLGTVENFLPESQTKVNNNDCAETPECFGSVGGQR